MGMFSRIKGLFQRKRIDDTAFYREFFGALESKSGATVTWRTALEAVTAMACARKISEGLAQVPCKVFLRQGGQRVPAESHPLFDLLYTGPNDWHTGYDFFEMMGLHLVFCGNFFAFVNRVQGRIVEILPFEPQHVIVERNGWNLKYMVMPDLGKGTSTMLEIPAENMWHIRGPSWNGWMGLEGVRLAREAIGLAMATETHGARIFKNGAKIGGILSSDNPGLTLEKVREIREAWQETYGGNENTGKTAVIWGGFKHQAASMLNDQAQFNETRKFQVEEVCRAFGVMPIMVGYSDKTTTYASAEQMFIAHVVHTLGPWYARIEGSARKFLLTKQERIDGYYVKFIGNALMRGAAKDRGEYFSKALGSGGSPAWMTQDEVRELEELNPKGGKAAELPIATNVGGAAPAATDGGEEDGDGPKA